jgi:hypothetical protein
MSFKILDFECTECGVQCDRVTKKSAKAVVKSDKCECGGKLKSINPFQTRKAPTCRVQWEYIDTANQRVFDSKRKMTETLKRQGLELVT